MSEHDVGLRCVRAAQVSGIYLGRSCEGFKSIVLEVTPIWRWLSQMLMAQSRKFQGVDANRLAQR